MSNEAAMAEIDAMEDARCRALVAVNLADLEVMCSDSLIYTHTSTRRDTKKSWLERIRSGFYVYLAFESVDRQIRICGATALVTGQLRSDVIVDGVSKALDNAILSVWIREGSAWRFVAYQPTPVPTVAGTYVTPPNK